MAVKKPYLPGGDIERATWLNNFAAKFPTYAPIFGFVGADVTSVNNDKNMWAYIVNIIEQNKADMQEFTKYKTALRNGPVGTATDVFPAFTPGAAVPTLVAADIFGRIGKMVQVIKGKPNYTVAIGEDLKIIGAESTFDADTFKTVLKAKVFPGRVQIDFVKSETDGVNIYAKLPSEINWTFLALDNQSPYDDTRPLVTPNQPEKREYRGRGVINNVEIGLFSDTVTVTFAG